MYQKVMINAKTFLSAIAFCAVCTSKMAVNGRGSSGIVLNICGKQLSLNGVYAGCIQR